MLAGRLKGSLLFLFLQDKNTHIKTRVKREGLIVPGKSLW
ncbi:Hypothetical protein I595_1564 [Croceitalea dokdonensis DOKDO 023]|uniref:Uncharacterized protein n=1 Tax=Croceitalea dokdonensis DOKDO 023 TaxID=1300341 RepID=A0A0N8H3Z1_9FLAO|nr:Hypothetical protein I595_1564 [Croceitalea dokdonensis DOKDO 023]